MTGASGVKGHKMVVPGGDKPVSVAALMPTVSGQKVLAVAGETYNLANNTTPKVVCKKTCVLGGVVTIKEKGGNAVVVTLYDGNPATGSEGVEWDTIGYVDAAANGIGKLTLGGAMLVARRSLWIKAAGTTPNVDVSVMINY